MELTLVAIFKYALRFAFLILLLVGAILKKNSVSHKRCIVVMSVSEQILNRHTSHLFFSFIFGAILQQIQKVRV